MLEQETIQKQDSFLKIYSQSIKQFFALLLLWIVCVWGGGGCVRVCVWGGGGACVWGGGGWHVCGLCVWCVCVCGVCGLFVWRVCGLFVWRVCVCVACVAVQHTEDRVAEVWI